MAWYCKDCDRADNLHACRDFSLDDSTLPVITNGFKQIKDEYEKRQNVPFFVIGVLESIIGRIKIVKDCDPDSNEPIIMLIWETLNMALSEFRKTTRHYKMKRLYFSNVKSGIKQYCLNNKHAWKHLEACITKLETVS